MSTKNLGSVKAYIRSATAPTNIDILWRDISVSPNDWKAYDTVKLKWESILGSTEVITVESATVYDPNRAIGYEAGNTFVSFVNENSANPIFQTAALYRCRVDVAMGISPEDSLYDAGTNPTGAWEYQGTQVAITEGSTAQTHVLSVTNLREITGYKNLHTVVVIDEGVIYQYQDSATSGVQPNDNQTSNGRWVNIGSSGGGDTIDASGFNGNLSTSDDTPQKVAQKFDDYTSASDVEDLGVATTLVTKKMLKVNATGDGVDYTEYDHDQVLNTEDINVSDPTWMESEERLLLVKKVSGSPAFEGAAALVDIFAPPGVEPTLRDNVGWTNDVKTITGDNSTYALGQKGQVIWLNDHVYCQCTSAIYAVSGNATYTRNRNIDVLDATVTQDAVIANQLDPSYTYPAMTVTGNSSDLGWDLTTQTKVITSLPVKLGSWFVGGISGAGYEYHCFAVNGTTSYWKRRGTPDSYQRPIYAATHPTLAGHLLAHDFSTSAYTQVVGDEATYADQTFYDATTRAYFIKMINGNWEKLR